MHAHIHKCMHTYAFTDTHTYAHTGTHTYTCTYTHKCRQIHTHTHTLTQSLLGFLAGLYKTLFEVFHRPLGEKYVYMGVCV